MAWGPQTSLCACSATPLLLLCQAPHPVASRHPLPLPGFSSAVVLLEVFSDGDSGHEDDDGDGENSLVVSVGLLCALAPAEEKERQGHMCAGTTRVICRFPGTVGWPPLHGDAAQSEAFFTTERWCSTGCHVLI